MMIIIIIIIIIIEQHDTSGKALKRNPLVCKNRAFKPPRPRRIRKLRGLKPRIRQTLRR
jgi:hypothetical protein